MSDRLRRFFGPASILLAILIVSSSAMTAGAATSATGRSGQSFASLSGVVSVASDGNGYCALLGDGGVECWGYGYYGQLGDGTFYGDQGSAVPVAVKGVNGAGTLTGVTALVGNSDAGYCAIVGGGGLSAGGTAMRDS